MINVLQIGLSSNPGGVETCILNYVKHINRKEFKVDFVDIYGEGIAFSEELINIGCCVYTLSNYKKHPLRMACELKEVLRKEKYEIIHINLLSAANLLPVIVSTFYSNGKVIVHSHNAAVPSNLIRRILNRINLHYLRKMNIEKWACGRKAGQWMWGDNFRLENVINNAINVERFQCTNEIELQRIRNELGFNNDSIIIGFIGHLVEQKNVLFLSEIINNLHVISSKYKLLIIGTGPLYEELKSRIDEDRMAEYVFWAGNRKDIENWYHVMDVFILPSKFEGFPMVGVEAQAAGCPCLFSDLISPEIKITDNTKFLPINNGAVLWAEAIDQICNNQMNRECSFSREYDIKFAVKNLEKKYRELLHD